MKKACPVKLILNLSKLVSGANGFSVHVTRGIPHCYFVNYFCRIVSLLCKKQNKITTYRYSCKLYDNNYRGGIKDKLLSVNSDARREKQYDQKAQRPLPN